MLIKTIPVGQLETNCYVVTNEDTLECVVIDPGDEANTILDYLESNHLKCRAVFLTHAHADHIGALTLVAEELDVPFYMNEREKAIRQRDRLFLDLYEKRGRNYDDGDTVDIAGLHFQIVATPGHTPGGVTIRCEDALFTGDTLFKGSCGRTDLRGGDMEQELKSLKKICLLPGHYEVYPGHMDSSTLEREREFNYYCRSAMRS